MCWYSLHKIRIKETVSSFGQNSQSDVDNNNNVQCILFDSFRQRFNSDYYTRGLLPKSQFGEWSLSMVVICIVVCVLSSFCTLFALELSAGALSSLNTFQQSRIEKVRASNSWSSSSNSSSTATEKFKETYTAANGRWNTKRRTFGSRARDLVFHPFGYFRFLAICIGQLLFSYLPELNVRQLSCGTNPNINT